MTFWSSAQSIETPTGHTCAIFGALWPNSLRSTILMNEKMCCCNADRRSLTRPTTSNDLPDGDSARTWHRGLWGLRAAFGQWPLATRSACYSPQLASFPGSFPATPRGSARIPTCSRPIIHSKCRLLDRITRAVAHFSVMRRSRHTGVGQA